MIVVRESNGVRISHERGIDSINGTAANKRVSSGNCGGVPSPCETGYQFELKRRGSSAALTTVRAGT